MLTDARLRSTKYKPNGKNRYPDRDGLYLVALEGGTLSFRYDFDDPNDGSHQVVVYGKYHGGDTGPLARLDSVSRILEFIPCNSTEETEAIGNITEAIQKARNTFAKAADIKVSGKRSPLISLEEARDLHRDFRRQLKRGINPAREAKRARQAAEQAATLPPDFKSVAIRWYDKNKPGKSRSWLRANLRYLEAAYPIIGARDIRTLKARDISDIITPVENSGRAMTAEKMRQCYSMVWEHAADKPEFLVNALENPAKNLTVTTPDTEHHASLKIDEVPAFLKAVDADEGGEQVRIAVKLLFLCLTRKMELCAAKWTEIDFANQRWQIDGARMKSKFTHVIPLSRQALALFTRLKELSNGSEYVFPHRDKPGQHMLGDTVNRLFQRIGYAGKATPHGCRSTASTTLNELGYNVDWIEKSLAHIEADEVRAAYNSATYMVQRRKMLEDWADAIDRICAGQPLVPSEDNVIQLHAPAVA